VVDLATRASPFFGLTLSASIHYHDEQVEGMWDHSCILSCSSFPILIDLVRCGLSPRVPTSLINVYCHDMWIEVPWNQSPILLVVSLWCSFIALLIRFL
jgi:hypothetical protein